MTKILIKLQIFSLITVFSVFFANPELANATSLNGVVFSLINWAGSSKSPYDEWLYLYNTTNSEIDLSGWQIFNKPKNQIMFEISEGIIPSKGYFLISNYDMGEKSALEVKPNFISTKLALSNTEFGIELRNSGGEIVDTAGNGESPFSTQPDPMERILAPISDGDLKSSWKNTTQNQSISEQNTTIQKSTIPFVSLAKVLANKESWQGESIKTTAIVVMTTANYSSSECEQCAIVRDSGDSTSHAELKLNADQSFKPGDKIEIIGKVSTAEMPRILSTSIKQLSNVKISPIGFKNPKLLQWVKIQGAAVKDSRSWFMQVGNQKIKLSRKQEVDLSTLYDGAILTVTGVIVSLDPLTLKIFNQNDFKATQVSGQNEPEVIVNLASSDTVIETFTEDSGELGNLQNFTPTPEDLDEPESEPANLGILGDEIEPQVKGSKTQSKGNLIWLAIVALSAFAGGIFLQFSHKSKSNSTENLS